MEQRIVIVGEAFEVGRADGLIPGNGSLCRCIRCRWDGAPSRCAIVRDKQYSFLAWPRAIEYAMFFRVFAIPGDVLVVLQVGLRSRPATDRPCRRISDLSWISGSGLEVWSRCSVSLISAAVCGNRLSGGRFAGICRRFEPGLATPLPLGGPFFFFSPTSGPQRCDGPGAGSGSVPAGSGTGLGSAVTVSASAALRSQRAWAFLDLGRHPSSIRINAPMVHERVRNGNSDIAGGVERRLTQHYPVRSMSVRFVRVYALGASRKRGMKLKQRGP